jgi:DNA polymerase
VHGYGAAPARVLFVGEAPGTHGADQTGVPFTRDRSGRRLQQVLIVLGLSEETDARVERPRLHCYLTNAVRCNPPANRRPAPSEVAACLSYLWQELALVQPEIVVPVGGVALQAIARHLLGEPLPPITQAHAQVWEVPPIHAAPGHGPRSIVPMRHPSRISNAGLARFVAVLREILGRPGE